MVFPRRKVVSDTLELASYEPPVIGSASRNTYALQVIERWNQAAVPKIGSRLAQVGTPKTGYLDTVVAAAAVNLPGTFIPLETLGAVLNAYKTLGKNEARRDHAIMYTNWYKNGLVEREKPTY